MRITIAALAVLGLGLITPAARADLAPPVPAPQEVKIKVELDEKAKGPKLIIPSAMTQPPRVRPRPPIIPKKEQPPGATPPNTGSTPPAKPEGEQGIDADTDNVVFEWQQEPAPTNRNHLLIAGLALTLSLSMGGLWVMRRYGRGSARALVLLVAAGATLAGSTVAWANVPPPKKFDTPPPLPAALPTVFDGKVTLEIVFGGGDTIRLVLDKATYEKLKEKPK